MNKHKIIRDTFFLTAIELILQGLSLLLNVFVTRKLGSSFMGMISFDRIVFWFRDNYIQRKYLFEFKQIYFRRNREEKR